MALKELWKRLHNEFVGTDQIWYIALQNLSHYFLLRSLTRRYISGRVLDIGAGKLPWRELLQESAASYLSSDLFLEHPDLDVIFDAIETYPFKPEVFDSVFSCSVLEHTLRPWQFFPAVNHVLKPGGIAIVSLPFMFYLHGQPHDYWRFTRYGLHFMAQEAGFEVTELISRGGIGSLILNLPSMILSSLLHLVRADLLIPYVTRCLRFVAELVDKAVDRDGLFASDIVVVARKKCEDDVRPLNKK